MKTSGKDKTVNVSEIKKTTAEIQKEKNTPKKNTDAKDAIFCALNAENMEHFIFLLEKQGFEVKEDRHIAVKVPGMKRFKRPDTISEDFSKENLEAMFKYGDAGLVSL